MSEVYHWSDGYLNGSRMNTPSLKYSPQLDPNSQQDIYNYYEYSIICINVIYSQAYDC
jgi:hypothetical protein